MARDDRPPSFQMYPREILTSQKTAMMTLEERGAYCWLLFHSWLSDQPGTLPDDPRLLAALSGANGEWARISPAVLAAFTSRGGRLVQPRLVEERERQVRRLQQAIQGGKLRASGKRDSQGRLTSSPTPPLAVAVAVASAFESKQESKPNTRASRSEIDPEGFIEGYKTYPRQTGRRAASKAFSGALRRHPKMTVGNLVWAMGEFGRQMLSEGKEAQFIPYPATWLNQDRFLDFLEDEDEGETHVNGNRASAGEHADEPADELLGGGELV